MMTERITIQSESSKIEILVDTPAHIQGIALITHPHPLMGGNPQHKIPQLMADILFAQNYVVWRPFFRGVGQSDGIHDGGEGESQDIAWLAQEMQQRYPDLRFVGGGFSFGAHVWVKAWHLLTVAQKPQQLALAGLPCGQVRDTLHYQTPDIDGDILLVHGEQDEICALNDVIKWAQPQKHPITILPGANHFFTGYLKSLQQLITRYYAYSD